MKYVKQTFGIWPALLSTTSGTRILWHSCLIHASSSTSSTVTLDFLDLEPGGAVAELTESEQSFISFAWLNGSLYGSGVSHYYGLELSWLEVNWHSENCQLA